MKIFEVNDEIKNYIYPIIKIIICVLIYIIAFNREKIFSVSNRTIKLILTIFTLIIVLGCILCMYISIIEISELHDRRKDEKRLLFKLNTKKYSVQDILGLVENNDIIEIEIRTSQGIIKIGSSSICNWSENVFHDKLYYCGNEEYETIKELETVVTAYGNSEELDVISIDGIAEK